MDIAIYDRLHGQKKALWTDFLRKAGLHPDESVERTALIWDDRGELIATASRQGNLLKCIAVDDAHQGEGLTATLVSQLRQDAFSQGYSHLFLYTKPKNELQFSSLFFYPIARTADVLLMENKADGIGQFLQNLPAKPKTGITGAAVMNCNPFTKGHRYLIETAARECQQLYVFVLSEDKSEFSFKDRMEMVKLGTADLTNVTVLPTGPYLISSATFPTYFLKDRDQATQVQCLLDIEIFCKYFMPRFSIDRRYVGTEPLSPMTDQYNQALVNHLPAKGIELRQIPRLESGSTPISASAVRAALKAGSTDLLKQYLPQTSYEYLKTNGFIK